MITIQELHAYHKLALIGVAPEFICPLDSDHGHMTPWISDNDDLCFWCLGCDTVVHLGLNQMEKIKSLLHR